MNAMSKMLEHLLTEAPANEDGTLGGLSAQIALCRLGSVQTVRYAGAIKKTPVEGVYELMAPVTDQQNSNRIVGMARVFFVAEDLIVIEVTPPPEEKSKLFVPKFGGPSPSPR